jgi:hypothetical protein
LPTVTTIPTVTIIRLAATTIRALIVGNTIERFIAGIGSARRTQKVEDIDALQPFRTLELARPV